MTAFFSICLGGNETGARTKSFHRRVSYKVDSNSHFSMPQNWFQAYKEANPNLFGVDSDFSDSDSENEEIL